MTDAGGIIAIGGDLQPERLLLAYRSGIFPWPHEKLPLLWFCPDPRMVLPINELHISRSLAKTLKQQRFQVTIDQAFNTVIRHCALIPRKEGYGTWITRDMIHAYNQLHSMGFAHSVEVWQNNTIVGGLYGISLGAAFFGESMFSLATNASKVAFATLVKLLARHKFHFVDCQVHTYHLESLGAQEWPRERFLDALNQALTVPTLRGKWSISDSPEPNELRATI